MQQILEEDSNLVLLLMKKLNKEKARKVFETFGAVLGTTIGSEEKIKKDQKINNEIISKIETVSTNELIGNEIIEKEENFPLEQKKDYCYTLNL